MCGIVGAIASRDVTNILVDGLKRLEYRGYDSAGIAVINPEGRTFRKRVQGKVSELVNALSDLPALGQVGIAHTRWATHGKPSEFNAHPHMSNDDIAIVHNGIIENHEVLKTKLEKAGYKFFSETDSEIIVHLLHQHIDSGNTLKQALQNTVQELEGTFALGVMHHRTPGQILAVRQGSPLVVGIGSEGNYIASDQLAILPVADRFIYLEEGDIAEIGIDKVNVFDRLGKIQERGVVTSNVTYDVTDKGNFRHFMAKEIFEQPKALKSTIAGRLGKRRVMEEAFGTGVKAIFDKVENVQIIACGTSYHAGLVTRHWLEDLAGIPCQVEVASEWRYRKTVVPPNTLFVTISQSGETADTIAALRQAKKLGVLASLCICNVPQSSLVRESDLVLMTKAGVEIGVASTKAFTTQLAALLMMTLVLGRRHDLTEETEIEIVSHLKQLPEMITQALDLDKTIQQLAEFFGDKNHSLFLGRGVHYPIALEGALKLKEISYIHAEAYPAGELKHGPLALVDKNMPVIAVAPNDTLLEKLKSNLQEVRTRGGELIVFADNTAKLTNGPGIKILTMPSIPKILSPIVYTIPLQLLSYHVAVLKGTDVDQPRNLAKSVTVE